jgi:two-component sensor histidine kinase
MNSQIVHLHPNAKVEIALIREANHRVANHLAILAGLIQIQMAHVASGPALVPREVLLATLRETAAKVIGIGHLHRTLSGDGQMEEFDLGDYLVESSQVLVRTLSLDSKVCLVHRLGAPCRAPAEIAQPIALMVNEIIMNSIKHAHPTGIPVEIAIRCDRDAKGQTIVEIGDDGVGLPENFDPRKQGGTGLHLVRTLASSVGALLEIDSDCLGTRFRITLPAEARAA